MFKIYRNVMLQKRLKSSFSEANLRKLNFCPYKALGVSKDATLDQVKTAYYKKVFDLHPDRHGSQKTPEFVLVKTAYEILSQSNVRELYDRISRLPRHASPTVNHGVYDVPEPFVYYRDSHFASVNPNMTKGLGNDRIILVLFGLMVFGTIVSSFHVNQNRVWYMNQLDSKSQRNIENYRRVKERSKQEDFESRMKIISEGSEQRQRKWREYLDSK